MLEAINAHREALQDLCRRHRVAALYVFGSATGNGFDPETSDLDFGVEFLPQERHGFSDVFFQLHEDLERLFDRSVDLVELSAIRNPYFRRSVEATRVPLYAA